MRTTRRSKLLFVPLLVLAIVAAACGSDNKDETTGTTALTPANTPPTNISTHGEYSSSRGCRGTFGSVGNAQATRIEADFTGTDCLATTFTGRVVLTKG